MGQVWYLIVSIPDLCTLTYFEAYLPYSVPLLQCLEVFPKLVVSFGTIHSQVEKAVISKESGIGRFQRVWQVIDVG